MPNLQAAVRRFAVDACLVLPTTFAAMLVQGYHPGAEDDGVYLAAIQHQLHPGLFAHDSAFFTLQMQATIYDSFLAGVVRLTHLPVAVTLFLAQFAAIALVLWGCLRLARLFFPGELRAQLGALWTVAAVLTIMVAGTAIMLVDQHLHPRTIATGLLLAMLADTLPPPTWARRTRAVCLMVAAMLFHPIMGAFGLSLFCALWVTETGGMARMLERLEAAGLAVEARAAGAGVLLAAHRPLAWLMDQPTADWRAATSHRRYLFLSQWHWYELLGLVAPYFILLWFQKLAERQSRDMLVHLLRALRVYFVVQFVAVVLIMHIPALERMEPLQPLRFLHLIYIFMLLIGGGFAGHWLYPRSKAVCWGALLMISGTCYAGQRALFPADRHLELPWRAPANPWTQAFSWIAANTPEDAYFALPPRYVDYSGEGAHGFRALALRGALADEVKDGSVTMQVPRIAGTWHEQTEAVRGWERFSREDLLRLASRTGVDWALMAGPPVAGMECPYRNSTVSVCKIR